MPEGVCLTGSLAETAVFGICSEGALKMNRKLLSLAGLVIAIFSFTVGSDQAEARHCGRQRNRCCQQNGNYGYQQNSYSGYRQNRNWGSNCGNNCGQSGNCGYQQSFNNGSQQCGNNG